MPGCLCKAGGRRGINEGGLFIQTVMKSRIEVSQVLCGDGEISPARAYGLYQGRHGWQ